MTEHRAWARRANDLVEVNRDFYEALWRRSRLVGPRRFNTWPLVSSLLPSCRSRLEVAPGLRPRLPLEGTRFVDVSEAAVAKLGLVGADARVGLVASLPFADAEFDLVAAFDVIEHVDDDGSALSELARVAMPGATLLLSAPLHAARWTSFDALAGHRRRYEPAELVAKLRHHGWTVASSASFGMQPRSSRLLDFGVWQLQHRRDRAIWWYDRVMLPLAAIFQKRLKLTTGMMDADDVDEVLLVCRRDRPAVAAPLAG